MSRDRMQAVDMTLERAENIVQHVIRERARWGKMFNGESLNMDEVLDALVFLYVNDSQAVLDLRESLRKSQQQLGASKARETRLNKINAELRGEDAD